MSPRQKILCIGYGYTAQALARRLLHEGWQIAGTTRSSDKAATLREHGVDAIVWDGGAFDPVWLSETSAILISAPPGAAGCGVLQALSAAIAASAAGIDWIGYLSTNGVYGDHGGDWVTEKSLRL